MNKKLTLEEKVCQKLIIGCNSSNVDLLVEMIEKYHIGGVILYKKNYNSYEEMVDVINRLKKANRNNKVPLFISIDQEGGRVNRMPAKIKNLVNAKQIANVGGTDLCYKSGKVIGEMLKDFNINMDFALHSRL